MNNIGGRWKVLHAVKTLKNVKAADVDSVVGEMLTMDVVCLWSESNFLMHRAFLIGRIFILLNMGFKKYWGRQFWMKGNKRWQWVTLGSGLGFMLGRDYTD